MIFSDGICHYPKPAHIADKLRGREFKTFDDFREALWLEISKDLELMGQFCEINKIRISEGYIPYAPNEGHYIGPNKIVNKFHIHHWVAIEHGGGVYDIDNLRIVTPQLHDEIRYRR